MTSQEQFYSRGIIGRNSLYLRQSKTRFKQNNLSRKKLSQAIPKLSQAIPNALTELHK